VLYGDGRQERDFTYRDDIVAGSVAAVRPFGFEVINLGSDKPVSLLDVIGRLEELLVDRRRRLRVREEAPGDVRATWAISPVLERAWSGRRRSGWTRARPLRRVVPRRAIVGPDDRHD
jgi:nucleoside-diphosphate-sugar epimerase